MIMGSIDFALWADGECGSLREPRRGFGDTAKGTGMALVRTSSAEAGGQTDRQGDEEVSVGAAVG